MITWIEKPATTYDHIILKMRQKVETTFGKHTLSNMNEIYEELVKEKDNLCNMQMNIESNAHQKATNR